MKSDYVRDPKTGALFLVNEEKRQHMLEKRELSSQIEHMNEEINNLKKMVAELLSKRN
jgi:hypothetical protein